jgi:hypothetical protein
MEENKSSSMAVVIITAIIGIVVGYGASALMNKGEDGKMMSGDKMSGDKMMARTDTQAADLRVLLTSLEKEHVTLAANAVRRGFDGDADFAQAAAALDDNSKALAKAVDSVYPGNYQKFYDLWASHIKFFVDYTVAAKGGDTAGMNKAVQNLMGYIDGAADFFSKANPNLPREAVKNLVTDHVMLLKAAVDEYGKKNYQGSYQKQHEAYDQIGKIADALAGAIVKQYPEKFSK